jgi:hypothetical protein
MHLLLGHMRRLEALVLAVDGGWRLCLMFFQGILGDDEGLVAVDSVGGLMRLLWCSVLCIARLMFLE